MTRDDIDIMWNKALGQAIKDGEQFTRYHFAELVAAAERESWPAEMEAMERQVNILTDALARAKADEREACAKVCEAEAEKQYDNMDIPLTIAADLIRARGNT